jgi:hypothetical protein
VAFGGVSGSLEVLVAQLVSTTLSHGLGPEFESRLGPPRVRTLRGSRCSFCVKHENLEKIQIKKKIL